MTYSPTLPLLLLPLIPSATYLLPSYFINRHTASFLRNDVVVCFDVADDDNGQVTLDVVVEPGEPRESLVKAATREKARYLFVGTHGRGRVAGALLGSVSQYLCTNSPCNLVICKSPPEDAHAKAAHPHKK